MHGGIRAGAGRKRGVQNKINAQVCEQVLASGESPLEYMLRIMRDPKQDTSLRNDMAKAAAPYLHPRLQAIEHSGNEKPLPKSIPVVFISSKNERVQPNDGASQLSRRISFVPSNRMGKQS